MDEIIKTTMFNLEKNGMNAYYLENSAEVVPLVEKLVPKHSSVSCGGSKTLKQTKILDLLAGENYEFFDRTGLHGEELRKCYLKAFGCDTYFCSANAVTENGELYNVDGNSNRVACIVYGPQNVIIIVGKNKIVKNIEEAVLRIKSIAAPLNAKRLNCKTPCANTGECIDINNAKDFASGCNCQDRICCNYVVSSYQRVKGRIKVIIVNEELGF